MAAETERDSNAALARRWRAAQRRRWQCKVNGRSAAAAGHYLWAHSISSVAAMSRAAGRQDIGGSSYSRAVAAVAARQRRCLRKGGHGSAEAWAGQSWQRGGNRTVLAVATSWQRRQSSGGSAVAAGRC
jgi:hypothetical protein